MREILRKGFGVLRASVTAGDNAAAPNKKNCYGLSKNHLPSIQFTSKATVFSLSREEFWHHCLGKNLTIANNKCLSVRQPANGVGVCFVVEYFVQTHREDFRIVILVSVSITGFLGVFVGRAHGCSFVSFVGVLRLRGRADVSEVMRTSIVGNLCGSAK